jgi:hypothetical protein
VTRFQALPLDEIYDLIKANQLLEGTAIPRFQGLWDQPSAESFRFWSVSEQGARAAHQRT